MQNKDSPKQKYARVFANAQRISDDLGSLREEEEGERHEQEEEEEEEKVRLHFVTLKQSIEDFRHQVQATH